MSSFFQKLSVRSKLQMIIGGVVGIVIQDLAGLDLSTEALAGIVTLITGYVVGQGIADSSGGSQ